MIEKNNIPDSWEMKTIGDVASEIRTGGTPKKSSEDYWGGKIPWKASKHFNRNNLKLEPTSQYITEKGKKETTIARKGEVLLVCRGAHTGKVGIAREDIAFNQDVKVIRLGQSMNPQYVGYYLMSQFEYFKNMQRGGTTKGITTSHVESLGIPVPSLTEQQRIVEAIEERLERIERLETSIKTIDRLSKEYQNSYILSLMLGGGEVSNKIPPSESSLPKEWELAEVSEVGRVETGGTPKTDTDEYWGGNITWLRVSDIGNSMYVSDSEDKITSKGLEEASCSLIEEGGIVVSTRATIGEVAIAGEDLATNQGFKSIIPDEKILDSRYLAYYLDSITEYLQSLGKGATYDEVNKTQIQDLEIPLPPIGKQREIADKIEKYDEELIRKSVRSVQQLFSEYRESVLTFAFQGEYEKKDEQEPNQVQTPQSGLNEWT